ncbi:MAG: lipoate--protein ligase family protein [Gemmatimonadetes bacterium]|nr:lipoate--protein ligase family protein [Gemmatimonadota bacterium]
MSASPLAALRTLPWRLLRSGPGDGLTNMATDLALLDHARRTGEATLRLYAWERPTLSLGRHERGRGVFDVRALRESGIDLVRRPTGGRALLHDHEVTYAVTAPATAGSLGETYRAVNALLRAALQRLGVTVDEAARAPRTDALGSTPLRPDGAPCFAEPSAGELVVDGAKLVGSAQWRDDGAWLQHGSILLADDQPRIARLRRTADAPGAGPRVVPLAPASTAAATLRTVLNRDVDPLEVEQAVVAAFEEGLGPLSTLPATALSSGALGRHLEALSDPTWVWRR